MIPKINVGLIKKTNNEKNISGRKISNNSIFSYTVVNEETPLVKPIIIVNNDKSLYLKPLPDVNIF